MEMGILGLPQSGKSTLFEIMTGGNGRDSRGEPCQRGLAAVPDSRFDHLVNIFRPLKVSPARVPFIDVHFRGDHPGDSIRQSLNGTDGLIHIVDGFTTGDAREIVGHYRKLADDLILSDLLIVENRLDRMARVPAKALKPLDQLHRQILPRLKEGLEKGVPLRAQNLSGEEIFSLKSFSFLSIRPELVVVNLGESSPPATAAFRDMTDILIPVIDISCRIEAELVGLTLSEQKEFLSDLGVEEPAFRRVIRESFSLLGRICYFTVGEDEVKAWVIPAGSRAPQAAAAIHKDFERGFIKAEVASYEDFVACGNTLAGVKAAGKLRLEGKDYIVQDGDIISFRFNI
ncbi:MAG: GTPase, probable translation factor [Deltaproteobacteria bacterium]|nr:GTPase, probable translation factor [Deltaproteobacteria bacterium]